MRHFQIRTMRPPYGVSAIHRRTGIRLLLKSIADEEIYVDLPDHIAQALHDELTAALAAAPAKG
jgi:hypothetical protein